MKIQVLSAAIAEFKEAVAYYNTQSEGLGFEFAAEMRRTVDRIEHLPEAWHPLSKRSRRCRMNRFPYGVIYQNRDDRILIVAVMHLNRHPDSWKSRLRKP
jgi:hypothetical protein